MGFSKVDGALANALADEAEQRIGARIPKDTTAMLAKLNESIAADARDAARMREVDALVSGPFVSFVERVAEGLADEHARRHPNFNTWREMGEKDRQIWVWMVRESTTAFAAALLTDGVVEAFDNGYDNAFAPELDRFRAGIRAAIRAAGVEPVAAFDAALREELAAEHRMRVKAEAATSEETKRADQARAEADALRAEVAALRGLDFSDLWRAACARGGPLDRSILAEIQAALATVPPAKVANEVRPLPDAPECGNKKSPTPISQWDQCRLPEGHEGEHAYTKPEAPGLEPLEMLELLGFTWPKGDVDVGLTHAFNGLVERVNVLSAIAKRGGL